MSVVGGRVIERDLKHSTTRRRCLVRFSFALSIFLATTVIYQKFLLDTSIHGALANFPSTAAATLKTFLRSEPPSATTMSPDHINPKTSAQKLDDDTLLSSTFVNSSSCLSKQESPQYQKPSPHKPSSYLLSQLRSYEILHRQCGLYTPGYNRTINSLNNNTTTTTLDDNDDDQCRYIIWTPVDGLGNQIISLTSTFLYALLTRRVLLVNFGPDISNLFCEPFPHSSWLLPQNYPHLTKNGRTFNKLKTLHSLLQNNNTTDYSQPPPIIYIDLWDVVGHRVKLFQCHEIHTFLQQIPVLVIRSNLYYAPALFMTPTFTTELNKLFPDRTLVFHHLSRYLFHPSNEAWTHIKDYYNTNLAQADIKLGVQIRIFSWEHVPFKDIVSQILTCIQKHNLLPGSDDRDDDEKHRAVLVASLKRDYSKILRAKYEKTDEKVTRGVRVYQASSEEKQRFNNEKQNMMAWVEMYLLSLCDELMTTGQSTFGYVAQGLGGLNSVVLRIREERYGDGMCYRARTSDPCFMVAPRGKCKVVREGMEGHGNDYPKEIVKVCEDRKQGIRFNEDYVEQI